MSQLGAASFAEMKKQLPASQDPQMNAAAQCVSREVIRALSAEQGRSAQWEVVVFADDTPNAFALPGNKIGVHEGMFKVARTPAQLAAVIGHEVGHVIARHGNERVSQAVVAQGGMALASIVTAATMDPESQGKRQLLLGALGLGAQVGVLLPYGRTQEREADEIGLRLMARAGFDPRESVTLWKNMQQLGGSQPPEFLSTHPSHGSRIERLSKGVPEATKLYQQAVASGAAAQCPYKA